MKQTDSIQKKEINQADNPKSPTVSVDDLTILKNLLEQKTVKKPDPSVPDLSDKGREVKLKDAIKCISLFKPAMAVHGIIAEGEKPLKESNLFKGEMRMITEYEEFQGANLIEWMLKIVRNYDLKEQGKNVGIRLTLGIYTDGFLDTYLPNDPLKPNNPAIRLKKHDRITIFLVPYYYVLPEGKKKLEDDPDATAYELGGLHP